MKKDNKLFLRIEEELNNVIEEKARQKGILEDNPKTKSELIRRALDLYIEMSLYEAETPKDEDIRKKYYTLYPERWADKFGGVER